MEEMFYPLFEDELQKLISMGQLGAKPEPNRSAFRRFVEGSRRLRDEISSKPSMNKRMIEFMKRDWSKKVEMREPERQRTLKHMMNERMRREREKQSFLDLHSVLPHGTRNEKISIIRSAADEIRRLERLKEEMEKKNSRMEEIVSRGGGGGKSRAKIRVMVENPMAGIDSLHEVLKCLKNMGLSATSIGFELSSQEMSAVIEIDNEVEVAEVEAVVRTTLAGVDKWLANESNLYHQR